MHTFNKIKQHNTNKEKLYVPRSINNCVDFCRPPITAFMSGVLPWHVRASTRSGRLLSIVRMYSILPLLIHKHSCNTVKASVVHTERSISPLKPIFHKLSSFCLIPSRKSLSMRLGGSTGSRPEGNTMSCSNVKWPFKVRRSAMLERVLRFVSVVRLPEN